MIASSKLQAGSLFPSIELLTVQDELVDLGYVADHVSWKLVVVYRGLHCGLCKRYLEALDALLDEFSALKVHVIAVSADTERKARLQQKQSQLRMMLGYGLNPEQMQSLGLYISNPQTTQEAERPFAEPGLFVLNEEGHIQIVDISNSPFSRPDLRTLKKGIEFARDSDSPVRGTYEMYSQPSVHEQLSSEFQHRPS